MHFTEIIVTTKSGKATFSIPTKVTCIMQVESILSKQNFFAKIKDNFYYSFDHGETYEEVIKLSWTEPLKF